MENRTRINYREFRDSPPDGYEFTAKKLTEPGRKKLYAYWVQFLNHQELSEEMKVSKRSAFDWEWLGKYSFGMELCIGELRAKGFIKKIKIQ